MDAGKEEQLAGETVFATSGLEGGREKKKSNYCKVITVVLVCLLIIILVVVFSLRKQDGDGVVDPWLQEALEELDEPECPSGYSRSPLIVVSLDGFRSQYLTDHSSHIPVINKLRAFGTTTPYMRAVYPTKTFPSHYSIVTGLYPESHGIVGNKMYDVTWNAFFSQKTDEKFNPRWYQGEPIWITAQRHKLKAGTFFWPGSDVPINGTFPHLYRKFDKSIKFEERASTILQWLSLPQEERPDLYTMYLDEPDGTGHRHGPESSQIVEALETVDGILGLLMDGLKAKNLHKCVNVMITSDHGMEEASCSKAAFVTSYQSNTEDFDIIQGPAARIRPKHLPEEFDSFDYEGLLKNLSCRTPDQPMRPYLKEHLPKRLHFAKHRRIERGHLYMKSGWQAAMSEKEVKYCSGGFHGSDNLFPNMQGIFIGYGPGFKKTSVPPFESIELYNLMCDLLGITPAPNNGTHGSLNHLLKKPVHFPVHPAQLSYSTCQSGVATSDNDLNCSCSHQTRAMQLEADTVLLTSTENDEVRLRHLHNPTGVPAVVQPDVLFCLLHHQDYLNGYSRDLKMPLWVSYSLPPMTSVRPLSADVEECVRADVRIPASASQLCTRYTDNQTLHYGLMHPPYLSIYGQVNDSLLTSNMVPMYPAFKDVWDYFHRVLLPPHTQPRGVNVMSGPIFDEDFDGRADPLKPGSRIQPVNPTHFYLILTKCGNSTLDLSACDSPLQVQSFILPHRADHTESCASGSSDLTWVENWMQLHVARVRDIELLTGLSFYHDRISVEETLQLKTFLR
ncbi:ectonucleotide pyrophosphatase/phosphodiesterase family member 1 [Synchiropus picturatus]